MRVSLILVSIATVGLAAEALWAEGSGSIGGLVIRSIMIGVAVTLTAARTQSALLQSLIGTTYLAMIALVSVAAFLVDKTLGYSSPQLQLGSLTIAGLGLGYIVCDGLIRSGRSAQ